MIAIEGWHNVARSGDTAALHDLLDPDVTFESPVVHNIQRGRAVTHAYLSAAVSVLGGSAFRYVGEWHNATGAVLEFETEVDEVSINGVDIIRVTEDGRRIAGFKVMIRPLKAVNLVHRLMGDMLARSA